MSSPSCLHFRCPLERPSKIQSSIFKDLCKSSSRFLASLWIGSSWIRCQSLLRAAVPVWQFTQKELWGYVLEGHSSVWPVQNCNEDKGSLKKYAKEQVIEQESVSAGEQLFRQTEQSGQSVYIGGNSSWEKSWAQRVSKRQAKRMASF